MRLCCFFARCHVIRQVDIMIEGDAVFVHPTVRNTNTKKEVRGYWWTNVAVKTEPKGEERVLMPAKWGFFFFFFFA